jgi:hypothetical protein
MSYQISEHTLARQMSDELVLVNIETNRIFVANDTGSVIWRGLQSRRELSDVFVDFARLAPDAQQARRDFDAFIGNLVVEGFLLEA